MEKKILRPMVKDLALLDLPFLSYGQITVNFSNIFKNGKNLQLFGHNSKTVSPIELDPLPLVLEFSSASLEVSKPPKFKTSKFDFL